MKSLRIKIFGACVAIAIILELLAFTGVYERYLLFQQVAVVVTIACIAGPMFWLAITYGDYEE